MAAFSSDWEACRMSVRGTKRQLVPCKTTSEVGGKADLPIRTSGLLTLTHTGSGPLGNDASSRVRPSHPYLADIERSFGGSDASRVNTSVRGEVVDLAARDTDIH